MGDDALRRKNEERVSLRDVRVEIGGLEERSPPCTCTCTSACACACTRTCTCHEAAVGARSGACAGNLRSHCRPVFDYPRHEVINELRDEERKMGNEPRRKRAHGDKEIKSVLCECVRESAT